jgi:predicted ATPase
MSQTKVSIPEKEIMNRNVRLPVSSFRLKNFKAVRDSGIIKFTPLTVFIGNNGSGKSSMIEAFAMLQTLADAGLDAALAPWRGLEYIQNLASTKRQLRRSDILSNAVEMDLRGMHDHKAYSYHLAISKDQQSGLTVIQEEKYHLNKTLDVYRGREGIYFSDLMERNILPNNQALVGASGDESLLSKLSIRSILPIDAFHSLSEWQFLTLTPQTMGYPRPQSRTSRTVRLSPDGSNIAEYLLSLIRWDEQNGTNTVDGIVETLKYILPYAKDVQPALTSGLEQSAYLQLSEGDFRVLGWLLSTGTLRALALLAVLRHPMPPPVLIIEEIENGLDPRTIHLMVEEIRNAVESGRTQVIITTHSPYLLDLLTLSQIIVVERDDTGSPVFTRPGDNDALKAWSEKFTPGKLYTMSRLGRNAD